MTRLTQDELRARAFESMVRRRMIELEVERRDGFAVPGNKVNYEAVLRSIAAGVREVVEVKQDSAGNPTEIRHRLVRI